MGLDIRLYETGHPSFTDATKYFNKTQVDNNPANFSETFFKYANVIKKINHYYDFDKINKTFGVKIECVGMVGESGIGLVCKQDVPEEHRRNKEYILSNNILFLEHEKLENFLYDQEDDMYAIDFIDIDFQHKGLNDIGWKLMPQNLSYCDDKDKIIKMVRMGGLANSFLDNWVEGATIFHVWW